MPIYDARAGCDLTGRHARPGSVPFPRHHLLGVFDAAGNRLTPVLWCDTETGEVGRYIVTDGTWLVGPTGRLVVAYEQHPAPLRPVPSATGLPDFALDEGFALSREYVWRVDLLNPGRSLPPELPPGFVRRVLSVTGCGSWADVRYRERQCPAAPPPAGA